MKAGAAVGKKVKELYLVKVSDIDKIFEPREFPDYMGSRIVMKDGGVWHKMPLIYNSGDYEEYSDDSDQDRNYDVSLIFREQMLSIGRTYFWQRFEREKVVAVFRAGNDLTYVVGSPEYPLSIYLYNAITDKIDREVSVRGMVKQGAWHAWIDEDAIIEEDEEPGSIFFIAGPPGSNKWEDISGRPDMDLYSSKTWVQAQGYLKYEALAGYATQDWVNSRGFLQTETDPTVPGHIKAISTTQISNWSSAYSWGNHAAQGYITSLAGYATQDWVNGRGFLEMETDPTVPGHVKAISGAQVSNWDVSYIWGNHAGLYRPVAWVPTWSDVSGKPATFTPTDHEHAKADITDFAHTLDSHSNVSTATKNAGQVLLWNGGAWINYSPSWLTGYTETDPVFSAHAAFGVTAAKIANWDTAYSWGNHSGLYRPVAWVPTWSDVTGKPSTFTPAAHTHVKAHITDLDVFAEGSTGLVPAREGATTTRFLREDGTWVVPTNSTYSVVTLANLNTGTETTGRLLSAKVMNDWLSAKDFWAVTAAKIANWDTAYSWGNHSGLYRPVAWVPTWSDVTGKPSTFTPAAHTHVKAHITDLDVFAEGSTGLVPAREGATTTRFLREDGTWVVPTNSTYSVVTLANLNTGTETTGRLLSAKVMNDWLSAKDFWAVTAAKIANWDTAYSWGNHSGLYRPVAWVPTWSDVTGKPSTFTPAAHTHVKAHITDLDVFAEGSTGLVPAREGATTTRFLREDGTWVVPTNSTYSVVTLANLNTGTETTGRLLSAKVMNDWLSAKDFWAVTAAKIANWDTAYSWGNHSGLYRPVAWVPTWSDVTGKPSTFTPAAHTHVKAHITDLDVFAEGSTGLVPAREGATTTRFLREDGTWVVPTNSTYSVVTLANLNTGTETTGRLLSAKVMNDWLSAKDFWAVTAAKIANWDTAYSWGNHSGLYRPVAWVPTWSDVTGKPSTFTPAAHTHVKAHITDLDVFAEGSTGLVPAREGATTTRFLREDGTWVVPTNSTYSVVTLANLNTGTETTGRLLSAKVMNDWLSAKDFWAVTAAKIANWDTAYSWGNHSGLYRPVAWVPTWSDVTGKPSTFTPAAHTHVKAHITDLDVFAEGSTGLVPAREGATTTRFLREDGTWVVPTNSTYSVVTLANLNTGTETTGRLLSAKVMNDWLSAKDFWAVTAAKIANWDTAYSWGNHSGLYRPVAWVPTWSDVTGKPSTFTPAAHTHVKAHITDLDVFAEGSTGLVPAREGATTTRFLREDGTWVVPTNSTYSVVTLANLNTGTETTGRLLSAKVMNDWLSAKDFWAVTAAKIANWDTAYSWGNHATAGYVTISGNQTNLSGTKQWVSAHTFQGTSATPITINRTSSNINLSIAYTTTDGTVYAGIGPANTFAIGNNAALNTAANVWLHVSSSSFRVSTLAGTGNRVLLANSTGIVSALAVGTTSQWLRGDGAWQALPTNATLTRGTGLTGNNYNGSAATTWAVSYGTAAGTAAQGNDSRILNGQTAYSWGNHSAANYATQTWANSNLIRNQFLSPQTADAWISGKLRLGGNVTAAAAYKAQVDSGSDGGSGIYVRGNIQSTSNIRSEGIAYESDRRVKDNIEEIGGRYNILTKNGYSYTKKKDRSGRKRVGVVAQEWEDIPGIVEEWPDGVKTVDYSAIIPLLLEEIKSQAAKIENLERICSQNQAR